MTRMEDMDRERMPSVLADGLIAAWPIFLGYVPIGMAFGVLAQKAGISLVEILLMSVIVFAGSSQFIAVSMLAAGADAPTIIITTFAVNLRHLLMSSSLAVYLTGETKKVLTFFAYGVTDESFAINLAKFKDGRWDKNRALVVNHSANIVWIISTILGGYSGQFIPEKAFGIDYALIAMFIGLLMFQMNALKYYIIAIVSGTLAVVIALLVPGNWYIVIASVVSATLGVIFENRRVKNGKN